MKFKTVASYTAGYGATFLVSGVAANFALHLTKNPVLRALGVVGATGLGWAAFEPVKNATMEQLTALEWAIEDLNKKLSTEK